ncbi:hypothetical protein EGH25_09050 [Haladaptatus sp. F3-133]|uniref:Uncharacterized protein n=1 Tax=Halorutilus salinus TaxID=2487751 RepID=A0A9Q4C436_9EURY|nr:hypothetical protein [Halorutilus salinus]MCX2819495.1 hypothetical protein [Halorutilus salinus]
MGFGNVFGWFKALSPFQHAAVAVLLPVLGFGLLLTAFNSSLIPSAYIAVASFVSFGLLIPSVVIYVLSIYITEDG